jgi:hypothetical protein
MTKWRVQLITSEDCEESEELARATFLMCKEAGSPGAVFKLQKLVGHEMIDQGTDRTLASVWETIEEATK